jgi:hypothetical protein
MEGRCVVVMRQFEPVPALAESQAQAPKTELEQLLERPRANPYEPTTHDEAWRLAEIVAASGLYKLGGNAAGAYVILMTGKDLGLSQSQALRGIKIVNGSPAPSADTLVAVCLNSPACEYFEEVSTDDDHSTWRTKRKGRPERTATFSIADAKAAGVFNKKESPWLTYPRRMLMARAKAFLARDVFPDVTLGLYTPEELLGEAADVPAEIAEVAKWQAPTVVPPVPNPAPAQASADLLDPVPPPPPAPMADWRGAMRGAANKREAARIGSAAIKADPSIRAEAAAILKEIGK